MCYFDVDYFIYEYLWNTGPKPSAHKACLEIDWRRLLDNMRTPIVYDGRRVLDLENLRSMGWKTHAVGRPASEN